MNALEFTTGHRQIAGVFGAGEILGPRYINVWVEPSTSEPLGGPLQLIGRVTQSKVGGVTTLRGGADGQVVWSGARFELGDGASLQIQPLKPVSRKP